MLELGQPWMLLAAAGMLIPLAVHLWNRRPPRLLPAGSIRWFRGSTTQSARSLQLKNVGLLLLRCLLLLVFSLLLAGLFWQRPLAEEENQTALFLIQAEMAGGKSQEWVDSLGQQGKEARLLAPGLPPLEDSLRWKQEQIDIWGIMQEADALPGHTDTVWIQSPLLQQYFNGERPSLHRHFVFNEPEYPHPSQRYTVQLVKNEHSLQRIEMEYLPERISFKQREEPFNGEDIEIEHSSGEMPGLFEEMKVNPAPPDTFFIAARPSEKYTKDAEIIRQAFGVLDEQLPGLILRFKGEEAGRTDLLLWLSDDSLPQEVKEQAMPVLQLRQEAQAGRGWLKKQDSGNNHYTLLRRPLPGKVGREELARLPLALLELLPTGLEQKYGAYLQMPLSQAKPFVATEVKPENTAAQPSLHEWLWLLLVVLFMVERIWASLK